MQEKDSSMQSSEEKSNRYIDLHNESVLNCVPREPSCPTYFMCLRAFLFLRTLRPFIFLRDLHTFFYVPYLPFFFTCLTYPHLFCLTCPNFFKCLTCLHFFTCYVEQPKTNSNKLEQTRARQNKPEYSLNKPKQLRVILENYF